MEIGRCLWELLFQHECVVLPGFGGFVTHFQPARKDERSHDFLPSRRLVSFNEGLRQNDGLLIIELARKSGIGYPESRKQVQDYVASLQEDLAMGKKVEIPGIGLFYRDNEQNLQFEPPQFSNFLPDTFGLQPVTFLPLAERQVGRDLPPAIPASGREPRRYTRWITAVPLALALAFLIPQRIPTNRYPAGILPDLPRTGAEKTAPALPVDSITQQTQPADSLIPATETPSDPRNLPASSGYSANPQARYHVIGGSLPDQNSAQILLREFSEKGYEPCIISSGAHRFRIALFSTNRYTEALATLEKIRLAENNPQIWLLK